MFWWLPATKSTFLTLSQEEFSSQVLWDAPKRCNLDLGLMKFHPKALALIPKVIHTFSQVPKWHLPVPLLHKGPIEGNIERGEPQDGTTNCHIMDHCPSRDPQRLFHRHYLPRNLR